MLKCDTHIFWKSYSPPECTALSSLNHVIQILNKCVQTIKNRVLIKYFFHIQISVVRGAFMDKTRDQYKGLHCLASASITLQYIPLKYERKLSPSCFLLLFTALSSSSNNFSLSLPNVSQCKSQLSQYLPSQF